MVLGNLIHLIMQGHHKFHSGESIMGFIQNEWQNSPGKPLYKLYDRSRVLNTQIFTKNDPKYWYYAK